MLRILHYRNLFKYIALRHAVAILMIFILISALIGGSVFMKKNAKDTGKSSFSSYILIIWDYLQVIIVAFILVFGFIRPFIVEAFRIPSGSMEDTLLVGDRILVCKFMYGIKIPGTKYRIFDFHKPRRGDIIVFTPPHERKKNYIKRLVGIPSDIVETRDIGENLYVNGKLASDEYTKHVVQVTEDRFGTRLAWHTERGREVDVGNDKERKEIYDKLLAYYRKRKKYNPGLEIKNIISLGFRNYGPKEIPEDHVLAMGDNRDNSLDGRDWGFINMNDIKGGAFIIYWSYQPYNPYDPGQYGISRWNFFKRIRFGRIGHLIRSQKIIED